MKHLGDITRINGAKIEPVDCITFGSPCQDLSIAGKRSGLSGERSGLFLDTIRIIREMREATNGTYPTFAVWENVPGAFSSNGGEDFRTVLEHLAGLGEPGVSIPKPKGRWKKSGAISGDGWSLAWRTMDAQYWGVPQRRRRIALILDLGGERAGKILFERSGVPGDPQESVPLWPGIAHPPKNDTAKQDIIGVINDQGGVLIGMGENEISPTLRSECHGNLPIVFESHAQGAQYRECRDVAPTCLAGYGMGGGKIPICLQGIWIDRDGVQNGAGYAESDTMYTLNATDRHGICGTTLRRLTPLECERLQGYPDGWTEIPDTLINGKKVKCSDTARYKALGNSIALPQWWWLVNRMAHYFPTRPTLGSLFDGIGGFPLVWETLHGEGTARWASEIEPFCIAVTTYHFSKK